MDRIVYYGNLNEELSEEIFEKVARDISTKTGKKFYYLLPNGELIGRKRQELISRLGVAFDLNLLSFDNLVKNILKDENICEIGQDVKKILIKKTLDGMLADGRIVYYENNCKMDGFISVISSVIGDLKRNLIQPEEFLKSVPNEFFYREIGEIYLEYENMLRAYGLCDREGIYLKAIEVLRDKEKDFLVSDLDYIVVDGFYNFRPVELKLLEELGKSKIDIYINLPYEFQSTSKIVEATLKSLEVLNFKLDRIQKPMDDFQLLASSLFDGGRKSISGKNINLYTCPNINLEVKNLFKQIKILLKNGVKMDEISVISLDKTYVESIYLQNKYEKLPINYEFSTSILNFKIMEELLSLLSYLEDGLNRDNFLKLLKFKYISLFDEDLLEHMEVYIRGIKWKDVGELKSHIGDLKSLDETMTMDEILRFNHILEEYLLLESEGKRSKSLKGHNLFLKGVFESVNLKLKVKNQFRDEENFQIFKRNIYLLESIYSSFDELETYDEIFENISFSEYRSLLRDRFKDMEYVNSERNTGGINLFELINSRNLRNKHVFILGLSNNFYPNIDRGNFFFNEDNLKYFRDLSLETSSYSWKFENEKIKFALALSLAEENLYLSYNSGLDEENIRSVFLDMVLDRLEGESLDEKLNYEDIDVGGFLRLEDEDITNKIDFIQREIYTGENRVLDFQVEFDEIKLGTDRFRSRDSRYNGKLDDESILEDLRKLYEDKVYSVSLLERYAACPYRYLLSEVFKLEDYNIELDGYSRLDLGSLIHEVLRVYYLVNSDEMYRCHQSDDLFKVDSNQISDILLEKAKLYDYSLEDLNNKLLLENTVEIINNFIINDIDRLYNSKNRFTPVHFEKEFGVKENFNLDGVKMRGKIDRIDKSLDTGKLAVMDYKLSDNSLKDIKDIKAGTSLQLPIYLLTNKEDYNLGLYGSIKGGKVSNIIGVCEENPQIRKNTNAYLTREEYEEILNETILNVKDMVCKIQNGDFQVKPKDCSKYCSYKNICRLLEGDEIEWR